MRKTFLASLLIGAILVLVGIGALLHHQNRLSLYLLERTSPTVKVDGRSGVGALGGEFVVNVNDSGSGLLDVSVRVAQNAVDKVLVSKSYPEVAYSDVIQVRIDPRELGLREGEAVLVVVVSDRSVWGNPHEERLSVKIDFERPRLEVLTVQHNGTVGGALFTVYRLGSPDVVASGIRIGSFEFPGYPANLFDPELTTSEVYASLYPLPTSMKPGERVVAFARDGAGNETTVQFYQSIRSRRFPEAEMRMGREFYASRLADLLPRYYRMKGEALAPFDEKAASDETLARMFPVINEDFRALLEERIRQLAQASRPQRFVYSAFDRPLPAKPTASFGEQRRYFLGGFQAGRSVHFGIDLAQTAMALVRAANDGVVVFADDLGIYGNTVVIDHGFGLQSLYGHLSAITCSVGENVKKGREIGRTGATGLAGGDHLHFELRLHGFPVSPFEWLDAKWVRDHIDDQIAAIKRSLAPSTLPSGSGDSR